MTTILKIIAKYIGLPLLEKLGRALFEWIKYEIELWKIRREQRRKLDQTLDAKTPDEIRNANRNNRF